jgi:hypothetical protein
MKKILIIHILLILSIILSACAKSIATPTEVKVIPSSTIPTMLPTANNISTITPTKTNTPTQTPTATFTPYPTPIPSLTAPAPLPPEKAEEILRKLLADSSECLTPCFLGIEPGLTTLEEVNLIVHKLGLQVLSTIWDNNGSFFVDYKFDRGMSFSSEIKIKDGVVQNVIVRIKPNKKNLDIPREWLTYSPEMLIDQYGVPSKVGLSIGRKSPKYPYTMDIFYNELGLVIEYVSYDIRNLIICPLIGQIDYIRIWLGPNQKDLPFGGVPLETATNLTIEEFTELMTGDPGNACIRLINDKMP